MGKICLLLVICLTIHMVSAKTGPSLRHIAEDRGIHLTGEETMDTFRVRRATLNEQRRQSHMHKHKRSVAAKIEDKERAKRSYHHVKPAKQGSSMHHYLTKRSPSKVAHEYHNEKRSLFPQMRHDEKKRSLNEMGQHKEKRAAEPVKHVDEKRSINDDDNEHHNAKRSAQHNVVHEKQI